MICPNVYRSQSDMSMLADFYDRFFYDLAVNSPENHRFSFRKFKVASFEMNIWRPSRFTEDVVYSAVHRASLVAVQPGAVASDRYQIAYWL
jgi:hypothetical protein